MPTRDDSSNMGLPTPDGNDTPATSTGWRPSIPCPCRSALGCVQSRLACPAALPRPRGRHAFQRRRHPQPAGAFEGHGHSRRHALRSSVDAQGRTGGQDAAVRERGGSSRSRGAAGVGPPLADLWRPDRGLGRVGSHLRPRHGRRSQREERRVRLCAQCCRCVRGVDVEALTPLGSRPDAPTPAGRHAGT